jgi:phosphoribosylformimino-5-aminoimidazole carboxamide ribonucleotide (ProFAR) isomerase
MKLYILVLVVLCLVSLAAPAMAADLNATQTSYTEMQVDGTGFTSGATVTLSTTASIPVTASGGAYSYEITGIYLVA